MLLQRQAFPVRTYERIYVTVQPLVKLLQYSWHVALIMTLLHFIHWLSNPEFRSSPLLMLPMIAPGLFLGCVAALGGLQLSRNVAVLVIMFMGANVSWFAQILRGFQNCGRVSGAEEVRHGRDPDHSQ
jgi:hypothetical protein